MKTILAMGQSNMTGAHPGGAWNIPSSVTVWNNTNELSSATVGLGNAFVTPANMSASPFIGKNNLAVHACRYIASEMSEDVRLILISCSGLPIANWCNSAGVTGPMYARMKAILAEAGVTEIDAFLWHQGEGDAAGGTTGSYVAAWNALLAEMEADGYIDSDTPVVLGELGIQHTVMNPILHSIADASPRVGIADISCFPMASDLHFLGPSLVRAGLEYARQLMKFPSFAVGCEPAADGVYVSATGGAPYTTSLSAPVKVLVKAENGKKDLIQAGAFVADRMGVWEFAVRGCAYTSAMSVALLDETGAVIQYIAGSGGSGSGGMMPYVNGNGVIALGKGDKVFLGVLVAAGGSAVNVDAINAAFLNRMMVRYLGVD